MDCEGLSVKFFCGGLPKGMGGGGDEIKKLGRLRRIAGGCEVQLGSVTFKDVTGSLSVRTTTVNLHNRFRKIP